MSFAAVPGQLSTIAERIMDAMDEKVSISIQGYNFPVTYYDLVINQQSLSHHRFIFTWKLGESPLQLFKAQADVIKKYLGNDVTVTMKDSKCENPVYFKGIITEMEVCDDDGASRGYTVTGQSPTAVLDDVKQCRNFIKKSLKDIISPAASGAPCGVNLSPTSSSSIPYAVQYNETDWEFLQRMAVTHGEWLYYDGQTICFAPPTSTSTQLISGINLHRFTVRSSVLPGKVTLKGYDYNTAEPLKKTMLSPAKNSQSHFAQTASNASGGKVHGRGNTDESFVSSASLRQDLNQMEKRYRDAQEAASVSYSGISKQPLKLGGIIGITKDGTENQFIVIKALHESGSYGHYECRFEAIPHDMKVPHYTNPFSVRQGQSQPAKVTDNNDPKGLGRIIVEFHWGYKTDWIRMVQPHGGSGKGFYFIPELDEEVLVDFEGGNMDKPFVAGTMYNGKEISGYAGGKNDRKAIHTRSGHIIKFDDTDGAESITITDKNCNEIHLDTKEKNITITALEKITLNTRDFTVNASNSITMNALPFEEEEEAKAEKPKPGEGKIDINAKKNIKIISNEESISVEAKVAIDNSAHKTHTVTAGEVAKIQAGNVLIN